MKMTTTRMSPSLIRSILFQKIGLNRWIHQADNRTIIIVYQAKHDGIDQRVLLKMKTKMKIQIRRINVLRNRRRPLKLGISPTTIPSSRFPRSKLNRQKQILPNRMRKKFFLMVGSKQLTLQVGTFISTTPCLPV